MYVEQKFCLIQEIITLRMIYYKYGRFQYNLRVAKVIFVKFPLDLDRKSLKPFAFITLESNK